MFYFIKAGLSYYLWVFLIGFGLGVVRTLWLGPAFGETAMVLAEVPIMLAASWMICRYCITRFRVPDRWPARVIMGVTALIALLLSEYALAHWLSGQDLGEFTRGYQGMAGSAGLLGQLLFGLFPWLQLALQDPHGN